MWTIIAIILGIFTVFQIMITGVNIWIYWQAPKRRARDVSRGGYALPASSQDLAHMLDSLHFRRLGEIAIPPNPMRSTEIVGWIYVDDTQSVVATLIHDQRFGSQVQLHSAFENAMVETSYPQGVTFERQNYKSMRVHDSVANAVFAHRQGLDTFSSKHGAPRFIPTMDDFLAWDAIYRQRFARIKLRRLMPRIAFQALFFVYLWAWIIIFAYEPVADGVGTTARLVFGGIGVLGLGYFLYLIRDTIRGRRR